MRNLKAAITLLTLVPLGSSTHGERPATPAAVAWFPFVGLLIGAATWLALKAVQLLYGPHFPAYALLLAALVIAGWAIVTRLLHWDGLADAADGVWGSSDRNRRLEIMSDSATGAFGAAAIALLALVAFAALATLLGRGYVLPVLLAPVFGRLAATFGAWFGSPARPGGLGASVVGRPSLSTVLVVVATIAVPAAAAVSLRPLYGTALIAFCLLAAAAIPHVLSRSAGGITGDILGASILLSEAAALVAFALVW